MKRILLVCLAGLTLGLAGCSSFPARVSPTKEGLAKKAVAVGLGVVLRNNPRFRPLAQDVMDRIDLVIARGHTNPAFVVEFVAELAAKYELGEKDAERIVRTISDLQLAYLLIFDEPFPANVELSENAKSFLSEIKLHIATAAGLAVYFPKSG